jgi:hypothetical protein
MIHTDSFNGNHQISLDYWQIGDWFQGKFWWNPILSIKYQKTER